MKRSNLAFVLILSLLRLGKIQQDCREGGQMTKLAIQYILEEITGE